MLKSTIQINEDKDISQFKKLLAFLKRQNDTYEPKKSKILSMENVQDFLENAPESNYLLMKVVLVFGLSGACRRAELCNLTINDIKDNGSMLVVTLNDTKTKKKRMFAVTSECNGYELYQKYARLRPKNVKHVRFFLYYKNSKCSCQPIGINTFATIPKKIAEFLKLSDPASYTGHCLRRTSATFLADNGGDIQMLKRHGGWSSDTVAEGYVEESIGNKLKTSKKIFENLKNNSFAPLVNLSAETSAPSSTIDSRNLSAENLNSIPAVCEVNLDQNSIVQQTQKMEVNSGSIRFSNVTNCIFNFYDNQK